MYDTAKWNRCVFYTVIENMIKWRCAKVCTNDLQWTFWEGNLTLQMPLVFFWSGEGGL